MARDESMARNGGIHPLPPIKVDPRSVGVPGVPTPRGSPKVPRGPSVSRPIGGMRSPVRMGTNR